MQIQEKCLEQKKGLNVTFINLTKAFHTKSRTWIWKILEKLGCLSKFLTIVFQLHANQLTQVRYNNDLSPPFTIKMAWNKDASWLPYYSLCSSIWCSGRQLKALRTKTVFTYVFTPMVIIQPEMSTSPHQDTGADDHTSTVCRCCCSSCSQWVSFAVNNISFHRNCPVLWP